jgi:hypothetical protein
MPKRSSRAPSTRAKTVRKTSPREVRSPQNSSSEEQSPEGPRILFSAPSYFRHPSPPRTTRITTDPSDIAWFPF